MTVIAAMVRIVPSPRFSRERGGTRRSAAGGVRGLLKSCHRPLTLPIAAQWAPTLSPLKRGEGVRVIA